MFHAKHVFVDKTERKKYYRGYTLHCGNYNINILLWVKWIGAPILGLVLVFATRFIIDMYSSTIDIPHHFICNTIE